jgi:hypothetical protein
VPAEDDDAQASSSHVSPETEAGVVNPTQLARLVLRQGVLDEARVQRAGEQWLSVPRHATPRHATPRHATPRSVTPRHATPRGAVIFLMVRQSTKRELCHTRWDGAERQRRRSGNTSRIVTKFLSDFDILSPCAQYSRDWQATDHSLAEVL